MPDRRLDHVHDRRPRGARARGRVAARRGQARRRRGPVLLLRAQARRRRSAPAACAWSRSRACPKLQTSCSTPVKDGMVVYTQTDRVKHAQNAVVEFLLVNHPLDCPVCDKGGECPLQDISYGWGPGRSRFVEAKRNFPKPIALSPLVAIDRERCILCYRCVRFSQEVAEDDQLVFLERADHTFVGTFDGRPYVAPFSGNVIELCPVGALTNDRLPLPRAPWDIEGAGSICTLCPSQCNVALHGPRRARRARARRATTTPSTTAGSATRAAGATSRSHSERAASPQPLVRDGGHLRPATLGARARGGGRGARARPAPRRRRSSAGTTTNEEGYLLQRIFREGLGSPHVDSRARRSARRRASRALLAHPDLAAARPDIDRASAVLVLETRPDQRGADHRPAPAQGRAPLRRAAGGRRRARPTALDGGATEVLRFAPGAAEALLRALQKALLEDGERAPADGEQRPSAPGDGDGGSRCPGHDGLAAVPRRAPARAPRRDAPRSTRTDLRDAAALLTQADNVVVIWGERLGCGERGAGALDALADLALVLGLDAAEGSGLIEVPAGAERPRPARGRLPAGHRPGPRRRAGRADRRARRATPPPAASVKAFYLLHADPLRELPGRRAVGAGAARGAASSSRTSSSWASRSSSTRTSCSPPSPTPRRRAPSRIPTAASSACGRRSATRARCGRSGRCWSTSARRLGLDVERAVTRRRGARRDRRGGAALPRHHARRDRRPTACAGRSATRRPRPPRQALGDARASARPAEPPAPARRRRRRAAARDAPGLWASWVTERSPVARLPAAGQELELNPLDAERLGARIGRRGRRCARTATPSTRRACAPRARASRAPPTLIEGTQEENANVLVDGARPGRDRRRRTRTADASDADAPLADTTVRRDDRRLDHQVAS